MMKKISIILVMLFWCNVGFALSQQQFIDQYLSGKKLDQIEGVWLRPSGGVLGFYKSGSKYNNIVISHPRGYFNSGEIIGSLSKGSKNSFYGTEIIVYTRTSTKKNTGTASYTVRGNTLSVTLNVIDDINRPNSASFTYQRLWPEDIVSHNAKFKTKKDIADEEQVVADMVADAKKTCKVIGFEDGSEKFADCTLKLYTQKVDELVAERQAVALQNQTTTTTQSSGSQSVTIYDPVRDSRALIRQGQRMLRPGGCTFGVNC